MKKILIHHSLIIVLFVSMANIGYSSTTKTLTLKELCENSNLIIEARVNSIKPFYLTIENQQMIFSRINMSINAVHKGHVDKEVLEIITFGGTLDGKSIFAVDGPRYEVGETTLLFLEKKQNRYVETHYIVQGLSQGIFVIDNNKIYRQCNAKLILDEKGIEFNPTAEKPLDKEMFIGHIKYHNKF